MTRRPRPVLTITCALAGLLACGDNVGPDDERLETDLSIVRLAPGAPPLFNPVASVWARRGSEHEIQIHFQDAQGQRGDEFLELEIEEESLLAYPDGRPFAEGDSVLITVRVLDAEKILFQFEPAGLRFNPASPAELEISYRLADPDLNRDGVVDARDREIEVQLAIWRQAAAGLPFVKLGTIQIDDLDELEADLQGFSRLAIAY